MTEIEHLKEQIKVLEKKLSLLEEIENHKTPCEKAYRDAYGSYPVTDDMSGGDMDYVSWDAFQKGYNASKETAQERGERVHNEMEKVFDGYEVVEYQEPVKDDFIDKMVAELKGQTLYDICMTWWGRVFDNNDDMETCIDDLVDNIDYWLPKEQSAAGSQNAYVESAVEGYNDCLNKIKSKLR